MSGFDFHLYGVNLVLHTVLLSVVAWSVVKGFKNPHARSLMAAFGLLALFIVPWLSALQVPAKSASVAISIAPVRTKQSLPAAIVSKLTPPVPGGSGVLSSPLADSKSEVPEPPEPWTLVAGIWVMGFVLQLLRHAAAGIRLARWKSSLRPATASEVQALRQNPSFSQALSRVWISNAGTSPCVTGLMSPSLVLPENLLGAGQQRELGWALRHESGHLLGHDLRWLALFQLILAVLWWNPTVHHLVRIWADAREQICDRLAVAHPQDRQMYGVFLVALAARRTNGSLLAMADRGTAAGLKRRLRFMMEAGTCRPCGRGFITGGVLAVILTGLFVSQLGVRAETPAPTIEAPTEETRETNGEEVRVASGKPPQVLQEEVQFKFTSKFLLTGNPVAKDGTVLNEEALRTLMRSLAGTPGSDLVTSPSVTARSQQKAMMEIIREEPREHNSAGNASTEADHNPAIRETPSIDDPDYRFFGIRLEYVGGLSGQKIDLTCKSVIGHIPGSKRLYLTDVDPKTISWKKLQQHRAQGHALLNPSESLCISIGEIDPGRYASVIVTASIVDATGYPVDASRHAIRTDPSGNSMMIPKYSRPPLPPFTVFVDGQVATLGKDELQKALGSSTTHSPPCFVTPNLQLLNEALKMDPVTNPIRLPRVEMKASPNPVILWNELPDFRASYSLGDLPSLASFWWAHASDEITGSIGLVGDHTWCFELPAESEKHRRLLILNVDMKEE